MVLIGVSGSGKSTFARKHFKPTEILSSDYCRGLVSDDENSQAATKDAFEVLHFIARKRLAAGKLTVVDATNVQPESRKPLVGIAREFAMFGETTGETDEFGLPVRYNWAAEYRGIALVAYGHTPVPEPEWLNRTINLDTGCVFGGKLTTLRYPEKELVSVPAKQTNQSHAKAVATIPNHGRFPELSPGCAPMRIGPHGGSDQCLQIRSPLGTGSC